MIVSDSRSSPGLIPVVTLGRYLGISFSTGVLPVFHSAFRCFTLDNRSLFRLSLHLLPTLIIFQEGETELRSRNGRNAPLPTLRAATAKCVAYSLRSYDVALQQNS